MLPNGCEHNNHWIVNRYLTNETINAFKKIFYSNLYAANGISELTLTPFEGLLFNQFNVHGNLYRICNEKNCIESKRLIKIVVNLVAGIKGLEKSCE